jgi:acetyl-CoA acetyltransferase
VKTRFPARDEVAIVGVGTTPFSRDAGRSDVSLVVEASKAAIRDAGLSKDQIDGMSGTMLPAQVVQAALGIPELTYFVNSYPTFSQQIVNAMNAVFSGSCQTVLCYHNVAVSPFNSRAAAADPFRTRNAPAGMSRPPSPWPDSLAFAPSYAAWANRYFHEHDAARREHLGYIAINSRTNALRNEHAILRTAMTMEDYLAAPLVREPLFGILDMDYPVDGADAFVITTAERARDLPNQAVLIHAAVLGQTNHTVEENLPDIEHTAHQVVMRALWERSELKLEDIDLFQPYDGFSFICLKWFESVGYCGVGEAGPFIEDNWDKEENRILIGGRVPANTHGGSLSDGGTQGSGHIREAVLQLQGKAGNHQWANVDSALLGVGGFFPYTGGLILRAAS